MDSTEINIPPDLRDRVNAAWESSNSVRTDIDDRQFWRAVADTGERMAALWLEVRLSVRPDAESVLLKLLLDAEAYQRSEARRARHHLREGR